MKLKVVDGKVAGTITITGVGGYWSGGNLSQTVKHAVLPSHVRESIGKTKFGLIGGSAKKVAPFPLPKNPLAKNQPIPTDKWGNPLVGVGKTACPDFGCRQIHKVKAQDLYDYCIEKLGMYPPGSPVYVDREVIVEKIVEVPTIVEKIIEVPKGYVGTFEKREVVAFALTRELRGTERALRQAYIDNDADESLRLAARVEVIREVMDDMTVDVVEGKPQVVVARSPRERGLFDAV